jgi:5'-nucleotidase
LGYQGDVALAKAVPGISVIVGGHSHTLSGEFRHLGLPESAMGQLWQQGCLILHAGKHAESIGLSRLEFTADGKVVKFEGGVQFLLGKQWHARQNDSLVSGKIKARIAEYLAQSEGLRYQAEDQQIQEIISQDYRPAIDAMRQQVICQVARPLAHTRLPTKLLPQGSEISPLVCQGFYQAAAATRPTDFALHNAGGVRVSLKAGPLTKADICGRLLPFEIAIVSYQLEGKYLAPLIEGAINNATNNGVQGTGDGSFPYFYKLRYHYEPDAKQGQRVTQIELHSDAGWQPLDPQRHYRGVSSAYTLAGKEGYHALLNSYEHQDLGMSMSDSFVLFAQQQASLD